MRAVRTHDLTGLGLLPVIVLYSPQPTQIQRRTKNLTTAR